VIFFFLSVRNERRKNFRRCPFEKVFSELFEALDRAGQSMLEALTGPLKVEQDYLDKLRAMNLNAKE
jgi:hypothetical protein